MWSGGRRKTSLATRGSTSTGPAAPGLAWFSAELLGRLPDGLNHLLPVDIGRFRYRSDFVARRSGEDLPPFRVLEQALSDTALARNKRSRNLRPASNPNVYACFARTGAAACTASSNPIGLPHFLAAGHWTAASPSSSRKRPNSNS